MIHFLLRLQIFAVHNLRLQGIGQAFQHNVRLHADRPPVAVVDRDDMVVYHEIIAFPCVFFLRPVILADHHPVLGKGTLCSLSVMLPSFKSISLTT